MRRSRPRLALTGRHNRPCLARLPLREATTVGVALVALDNFKFVNDTSTESTSSSASLTGFLHCLKQSGRGRVAGARQGKGA